jgi:4,5-dihydroxyphthalate decarboxylase
MSTLTLNLGFNRAPNTRGLFDGSVRVEGAELKLQSEFGEGLDNVGARHRKIIAGDFDGGELSISSYILARKRGLRLRALPVFLSRKFRHRCMYLPVKSPLRDPSELAGKKITIHRYNATTPVWLKGILQNEYGVKPETVEWFVAEPDIAEESRHPPPPEIRVRLIPEPRTREHAIEMLERGEVDAALEPYDALGANPKLRRIVPDHRRVEEDFFRRTGCFPINHLFVLKEEIAEANPWVVEGLLNAFREAETMGDRYRNEKQKEEAAWEKKVMGGEFAYSLNKGPARKSLETLFTYQMQQGTLDKKPDLESLFFPQVLNL